MMIAGQRCRCGFATVAMRRRCPRCGKAMAPVEWPAEGTVVSFTRLSVVPEGFTGPYNLVLVQLGKKGPKLLCWTQQEALEIDAEVLLEEHEGRYRCAAKGSV